MMHTCPSCGAGLETPLGCVACGVLVSPASAPSPFEALGLEPAFALDAVDLKRRLLRFSRLSHPDFFATASPETRELAERGSAILNDAYAILSDDFRRADWLVTHLGGPSESDEREMPKAFLMEVLEWNETLEQARNSDAPASLLALDELHEALVRRRAELMRAVGRGLAPLPSEGASAGAETLTGLRRSLNAVRYVDRALREIRALRLARAAR